MYRTRKYFIFTVAMTVGYYVFKPVYIVAYPPDIVSVPAKLEDYYKYDPVKKKWIWSEDLGRIKPKSKK